MHASHPVTVLNVDDDEPGRYTLTRQLRQAGYIVWEAGTGAEALRRLADMPDVVLLDVNLPDTSGLEVAQRIKANPLTAHIPVIHLSATAPSAQDQAAGLQGAEAYLVQPVSPVSVLALVEALLRYRDRLRQAESRYEAALRGSSITVFTQDRDLRYTWIFNPSPGFDPLDVVGKTETDLLPAADAAQLERIKRRVLATGQSARDEVTLAVPLGRRVFDLTVDPVFGPGGGIPGVTCVSVDITERKQAEAAVREHDARFRAVWEVAHDAMVLSDPDGVVIDANPAYYRLYGYPPEQVLGHSFAIIFPADQRAWAVERYRQVFASQTVPPRFESTIQRGRCARAGRDPHRFPPCGRPAGGHAVGHPRCH